MANTNKEVRGHFAANVERLRRHSGLSVKELAERSQTDEQEVTKILRGEKDPPYGTIALLAGALGVDPGELFRGIAWIPPEDGGQGRYAIEDLDGD